MLDLFGTTASPQIAERTAKIGLLTAPPPADEYPPDRAGGACRD